MADLFESNWSATKEALLEGLSGNRKTSLDVVLENSKSYLNEAATAGATGAGSVATLNKVMLPLIRRVREMGKNPDGRRRLVRGGRVCS